MDPPSWRRTVPVLSVRDGMDRPGGASIAVSDTPTAGASHRQLVAGVTRVHRFASRGVLMLPAAIAAGRVPSALTSLRRPRSWQRLAAPVVCVALTALGWPAFASAAGTTVIVAAGGVETAANAAACTTTGSAVSCPNLRDAVAYANAGTAGLDPTIELGAGTSELSLGPLQPTISMTIAGAAMSAAPSRRSSRSARPPWSRQRRR